MNIPRITLFGSPRIEVNQATVDPGRRKVSALAACISTGDTPRSRDGICALLWPEKSARTARAELRRTISTLRSCAGADFVEVTRSSVTIGERVNVDVREFRELVSSVSAHHSTGGVLCADCSQKLERAVALYKDDFLAGFSLSDSSAFDDWMINESERLRDLLNVALERLSRPQLPTGEGGIGETNLLAYARRWLQLDGLNEAAHRRLMTLYATSGQRGAALRQYGACERILKEELDASPSRETLELKCRIESGSLDSLATFDTEKSIESDSSPRRTSEASPEHPRSRKPLLTALFVLLAVVAVSPGLIYGALAIVHRSSAGIPIAVLPLTDDSNDRQNEWFAGGMTDEIITNLAQIGALRVTSRTSVEVLAATKPSIPEVHRSLGVDFVVEGSVLKTENRVRVTAQLIDAKSDRHLWADEYESDLTNIIALQRRIAEDIASEVSARLSKTEAMALAKTQSVDPAAYEAYLLGAFELSRLPFDMAVGQKSVVDLKRSIAMDESYAPAHAALANYYWGATQFGLYSTDEGMKLAKTEAERAVALDDNLSDAHTVLGFLRFLHDYDWKGSEREFKRAIELKPSSAEAHCWYGSLLCTQGRFDAAIAEVTKARDIDPLSLLNILNVAMRLYYSRDYAGAVKQAAIVRDMEENFYMSHMVLGYALAAGGKYDQSIQELETAATLAGDGAMEPLAVLSYVYIQAKRPAEAEGAQKRFDALGAKGVSLSPLLAAYIPLGHGDYDSAMNLIEQAYAERDLNLAWNFQDPFFDPLRKLPRFVRLKRALNL